MHITHIYIHIYIYIERDIYKWVKWNKEISLFKVSKSLSKTYNSSTDILL